MLADPDKIVSKQYGILSMLGLDYRVTFVIDKNGIVKKVYSKVDPSENYKELLEFLKTM